jgi:hypothetical protein
LQIWSSLKKLRKVRLNERNSKSKGPRKRPKNVFKQSKRKSK